MASVFTYGGFTHADNEVERVTIDYKTLYSPRNKRLNRTITWNVFGEVLGDTSDAVIASAANIVAAYQNDYQDARFAVNGTLANSLLNGSSISGVKVVSRSFPKDDPGELATVRSFAITLQSTEDAAETDLVSWQEQIVTVGTGGPRYIVVETFYGPLAYLMALTTAQQYYQSGTAVGYTDYPAPPGPVNPQGEFLDRRRITRRGGRNLGNGLRFFTTSWSYTMGRDVSTFGTVDFRPTSQ